jgi:hypothetical protein
VTIYIFKEPIPTAVCVTAWRQVGFPPAQLYADPDGATYKSIGFYKGVGRYGAWA